VNFLIHWLLNLQWVLTYLIVGKELQQIIGKGKNERTEMLGSNKNQTLHLTKVVFYWVQPFQPKPVLVETVEVSNRTLFQPFLVDTRLWLGIVISRLFCPGWQDDARATRSIGCLLRTVRRIGSTTLWIGWWIGTDLATLLLETEKTPATRITGYFENLSDSKFKNNFPNRRNTFVADSLHVITRKL